MFCFHKWVVNREFDMPSAAEIIKGRGGGSVEGAGPWFFRRKHVIIYRCSKCGAEKVKEIVNPN